MKNMKKLNKIMYGLLFLLLAATTSTFTSCRDEASVDPYFVASEADIELQYDGLTEKKQPGQFKMGANQPDRESIGNRIEAQCEHSGTG